MVGGPRSRLALVTIAAAFTGAGCGGSDIKNDPGPSNESQIRVVLSDLQAAAIAGNGKRICTQIFTPKLADNVTRSSERGSCADEVRGNLFSPTTKLTVQKVTLSDESNATATVKEASGNTSTVFFVRQSGRWRIRSIQPA